MNKWVILSCSANSPAYSLPVVWNCHLWIAAGWKPFVVAMGGYSDPAWDTERGFYVWSRLMNLAVDGHITLRSLGSGPSPWLPIPSWSHAPGMMAACACRRIVAATAFPEDDYVVIGDTDLLLCDPTYLAPEDNDNLTVWGSDFFEPTSYLHWPSCYQGAKFRVWREIMQPGGGSVAVETVAHMDRTKDRVSQHIGHWTGSMGDRLPKWDDEMGFHAMHEQWEGRAARTVLHPRVKAHGGERRLILQNAPREHHVHCPDPIDAHIRDRWVDDANWAVLMGHTPRVPLEMKNLFAKQRMEFLGA